MTSPYSTMNIGPDAAAFTTPDAVIGKLLQGSGKLSREDMDRVVRFQHEQKLRFGEAAVKLGLVTQADIQRALSFQFEYPYLSNDNEGLSQELIVAVFPYSKEAEVLRSVRAELLLRWLQLGHKILTIGCAEKNEGGSYLAANLAVLFAQLGRKTLLIDADLREPRQHQIFNLGKGKGLSDILVGRADATVVRSINSFPTLSILPAGSPPPNPSELLVRSEFGALLKGLASGYDLILIDTSPSGTVSDMQAAAALSGGVLITARRNVSKLAALADLKEKIILSGAQVVGAVVLD